MIEAGDRVMVRWGGPKSAPRGPYVVKFQNGEPYAAMSDEERAPWDRCLNPDRYPYATFESIEQPDRAIKA